MTDGLYQLEFVGGPQDGCRAVASHPPDEEYRLPGAPDLRDAPEPGESVAVYRQAALRVWMRDRRPELQARYEFQGFARAARAEALNRQR